MKLRLHLVISLLHLHSCRQPSLLLNRHILLRQLKSVRPPIINSVLLILLLLLPNKILGLIHRVHVGLVIVLFLDEHGGVRLVLLRRCVYLQR